VGERGAGRHFFVTGNRVEIDGSSCCGLLLNKRLGHENYTIGIVDLTLHMLKQRRTANRYHRLIKMGLRTGETTDHHTSPNSVKMPDLYDFLNIFRPVETP